MITKNLIAIFVILLVANAGQVSVGDDEVYYKPAFDSIFKLKDIKKDQTITVTLQLPNVASMYSGTIDVYLFTSSSLTQPSSTTRTCTATQTTCRVQFDKTQTTATGDYWLYFSTTHTAAANNFVLVGTVEVKGDSSTRINSTLMKQTVAIGQYRYHRIYSATKRTLSVILTANDAAQTNNYDQDDLVAVFPEAETYNGYKLGSSAVALQGTRVVENTINFTVKSNFNISIGYYWIVVDLSKLTAGFPDDTDAAWDDLQKRYKLSYSTEVYTCPFISDYPDVQGIFRGCQFLSNNSKLPCIDYDNLTSACRACYAGYNLINGKCVQGDCPAGQYKKYGQCIENPTGCAVYSDFAKCTQCSIGYTLSNGVCNRTPLICTGRTFFNSITWTCDNVNDKCKEWGTQGLCTSCLSATQKPVNGICVPIDSTCTSTQFVDAQGNCVEIDLLCDTFQKYGGKCLKCVWGYELDAAKNKCNKIVCPTRYVPNDYGKCVRVSDLCADFDVRGNCLGCIPTHTLANGVCLQLESPSPCPPRQYLGNDNFCHDVSDFCEIYDRTTGMCSQCIGGYYLMYTGECVMQKNCKPRQVLINNDCHDVSPTCGNYDRVTGKCLNCVSQDYELYYGLCIPVTTCGPRQWTDNNGGCHEVDAKCNTFNPSTGACTSCVQGYNYLNGICCTKGQFNIDGNCISATSASSLSNANGCRNYTNGIGCLRCDSGFQRVQDQYGFYYCQAL